MFFSIYLIPDSIKSGEYLYNIDCIPMFFSTSSTIEIFPNTITDIYFVENWFGNSQLYLPP